MHNISDVFFENYAKEVKNLKLQENRMAPLGFTLTGLLAFPALHCILGGPWCPWAVLKFIILPFSAGVRSRPSFSASSAVFGT
jgi:hypothetical protein